MGRPPAWREGRLLIGLAGLIGASFALSVWWTGERQPWAFFLLPPRAWELAVGGFLAVGMRSGFRLPGSVTRLTGWIGMAAILGAAMDFSDSMIFPGWAALLPVLGTVAVLASGAGETTGTRLLEVSPMRWLGKYSCSLYLWHWPLLVISAAAAGETLGAGVRASIVGVSMVLAVATFHLVENRVRFANGLVANPRRSAVLGLALTAVAVLSTAMLTAPHISFDSGRSAFPDGQRSSFVPAGMVPALPDASSDRPETYRDGCVLGLPDCTSPPCWYGHGAARVVLMGDSHAAQWFPALRPAIGDSWRLRNVTKSSCPAALISTFTAPPVHRM